MGKLSSDSRVANAWGKAKGTHPKLDRWLGVAVCASASRVSQTEMWAWPGGHRHSTHLRLQASLRAVRGWSPDCPPATVKGCVRRSTSLESNPYSRAFGKDARATCGAGTKTRDTRGEAKHTSYYLNRELHSHFKLNRTLRTCAKMLAGPLLPVPAGFAASEESERWSHSPLAGLSWRRGWAGLCHPLPFLYPVLLTSYFPWYFPLSSINIFQRPL